MRRNASQSRALAKVDMKHGHDVVAELLLDSVFLKHGYEMGL